MATTTLRLARTREVTVLGRLATAVRAAAPGLVRLGRRARGLVLQIAGLGLVTAAAWQVATALGLFVGGVALLVTVWLTSPEV